MKQKFAHIEGPVFQLGLIHLEYPKCILWYDSGFGNNEFEWLNEPTIKEGTQVMHDLEIKTLQLQREMPRDFP